MNNMIKHWLEQCMAKLARMILRRHQPKVIAITGSVGKTSTKEAIRAVLQDHYFVRASQYNYNNELGVPLTIIGGVVAGKNIWQWSKVILRGLVYAVLPLRYPQILILEMGADKPGDIKYLTQLAPADIGIVTYIGDQPVHVEFFRDVEQLAQEKLVMYKHLPKKAWAIVNLDESYSKAFLPKLKNQNLTVSVDHDQADLQAVDIDYSAQPEAERGALVAGLRFKIRYQGNMVPCFIPGVIGRPAVYAALFALAVGSIHQINLVDSAKALQRYYQAPPGRMRLILGMRNSLIIDDSYNASPAAVREALTVLHHLQIAGKKIACLGNMEELGVQSKRAHTLIGQKIAALQLDALFTFGDKAEGIATAALDAGMSAKQIQICATREIMIEQLQQMLHAHDVVLIKGSQRMRFEKIVVAVMANSSMAKVSLARQYGNWSAV